MAEEKFAETPVGKKISSSGDEEIVKSPRFDPSAKLDNLSWSEIPLVPECSLRLAPIFVPISVFISWEQCLRSTPKKLKEIITVLTPYPHQLKIIVDTKNISTDDVFDELSMHLSDITVSSDSIIHYDTFKCPGDVTPTPEEIRVAFSSSLETARTVIGRHQAIVITTEDPSNWDTGNFVIIDGTENYVELLEKYLIKHFEHLRSLSSNPYFLLHHKRHPSDSAKLSLAQASTTHSSVHLNFSE